MNGRSQLRNKIVSLRVTEADHALLESLADSHEQPLSEWCRETLLTVANYQNGTPLERALLAEVIALRTIVANLIYAFTNEGKVTKEQMAAFIERADKTKLKRATELLAKINPTGIAESAQPDDSDTVGH